MLQEVWQRLNIESLLTQFVSGFLGYLPNLVAAILIIVAAFLISRGARAVFRKALEKADFEEVLIGLLVDTTLHYVIVILGLLMALSQLGVNVTAALAGVGVAGIAIGFAAQDSVANVISGILIFWDKPFVVGDWIETEGQYGKVTNITLRTTRIRTPQNSYIVVPNKRIIDEVLENYSKHGEVRVDVGVGIAYKEDVDKARKVLLDALEGADDILDNPGPDVVVEELGGSSVNLRLRVWVEAADQRKRVFFRLTELAKKALDDAGIEIPFPHLQLIVDTVEERVWEQVGATLGKARSAG
ncbi:MAG: mechanosensitive ion channel family protein [Woeseiaceae bacterium]|nr:mechanosensitive ion channel family protein [Woeseiaceae bacterium]